MKQDRDDFFGLDDQDDADWELLSLYLDGETAPDETAKVSELLASDARYAREFSQMQHQAQVLKAAPEFEPPARLREAIFAQTVYRPTLAQRLSAMLRPLPSHRWVYGAAGAAALALTLFSLRPAQAPVGTALSSGFAKRSGSAEETAKAASALGTPSTALPENTFDLGSEIASLAAGSKAAAAEAVSAPKPKPRTELPTLAFGDVKKTDEIGIKPSSIKPALSPVKVYRPRVELAAHKEAAPLMPRTRSKDSGETFYSKKPMMDTENQRPADQKPVVQAAEVRSSDPDRAASSGGDTGSLRETTAAVSSYRVRNANFTGQIPKIELKTNLEMQREANERNGGYSSIVREGIQSQQIRIGFSTKL